MSILKLANKKVLILATIVAVAVGLTFYGLSPAIAAVNQTMNGLAPGHTQIPKINGSISVEQTPTNFMKDNLKVSFPQASDIAAKQIANGTIVGGHLGTVQGYLVYIFFVTNAQDHTGHLIVVDAGNGKVLYTSQGHPMGSFGPPMFGSVGPSKAHGSSTIGGLWHGPFGPWRTDGFGGGLSQQQYPLGVIREPSV